MTDERESGEGRPAGPGGTADADVPPSGSPAAYEPPWREARRRVAPAWALGVCLEPDDPSGKGIIGGIGDQQGPKVSHESSHVAATPREVPTVDQHERRMAPPDRSVPHGQAKEIADVPRDDSAALGQRRRPHCFVSRALKVPSLEHRHDIVPLAAQLDRNPGGEVLVEEKPHASREPCWWYSASSRSASSRLAAIQASISSGYAA